MSASFRFDMSKFTAASRNMAGLARKKPIQDVLKGHMKGFLRRAVGYTPPSKSGRAGSEDKKRGEAAIAKDVGMIFTALSPQALAQFEALYGRERTEEFGHKGAKALGTIRARVLERGEMAAWHGERRRSDGRVMQVHRDATSGLRIRDLAGLDTGIVGKGDLTWFRRQLFGLVGFLAAGFNKAAARLGVAMPAWIKRHGEGHGSFSMVVSRDSVRISIVNAVMYADKVKGLNSRIQRALNDEAKSLERQYEQALRRQARLAGFRR
jgi:hypothetical protein